MKAFCVQKSDVSDLMAPSLSFLCSDFHHRASTSMIPLGGAPEPYSMFSNTSGNVKFYFVLFFSFS